MLRLGCIWAAIAAVLLFTSAQDGVTPIAVRTSVRPMAHTVAVVPCSNGKTKFTAPIVRNVTTGRGNKTKVPSALVVLVIDGATLSPADAAGLLLLLPSFLALANGCLERAQRLRDLESAQVSVKLAAVTSRMRKRAHTNALQWAAFAAVVEATLVQQPPAQPAKRQRRVFKRNDPRQCSWYAVYLDKNGTWRDPKHRDGILFRKRFRMPWITFHEILKEAVDNNWFPTHMEGISLVHVA